MKEYLEDRRGFFNAEQFARTGEKFRPLEFHDEVMVVDNSKLAAEREYRRLNARRNHSGYRGPRR